MARRTRFNLEKIRAEWTVESTLAYLGVSLGRGNKMRCPLPECAAQPLRKSPSFSHDVTRFYCHRCKQGGDVIQLVMSMRGDKFLEACAFLSGIDADSMSPEQRAKRRQAVQKLSVIDETTKVYDQLIEAADEVFRAAEKDIRVRLKNDEIDEIEARICQTKLEVNSTRLLEMIFESRQAELFGIKNK